MSNHEVNPNIKISAELKEAAQKHNTGIKGQLLMQLSLAYKEITGKTLKPGCGSCLSTGLIIVKNYTNTYPRSTEAPKETKVNRVGPTPMEFPDQRPDTMLKLKELRVKYPHIKAKSVIRFLEKLDERYTLGGAEEWPS